MNKPKSNTNPRGVSLSTEGFNELVKNSNTQFISIDWNDYKDLEKSTAINLIEYYYNLW